MKSVSATVLYGDRRITVDAAESIDTGDALWIDTQDLPRINGFALEPHGACRGDVCVPLPREMTRGRLFNLSAFAAHTGQAIAFAPDAHVWSFSDMPAGGGGRSRLAPDFEVPDRLGRPVHLAGFRGKKALVVTWASW